MSERNPASEYDERLSALIDGELTAEEEREVREALAADADMRARLAALESVGRALRELEPPDRAAEVLVRVEQRIAREQSEASAAPTAGRGASRAGPRGGGRDGRWRLAAAVTLALFAGWFASTRVDEENRLAVRPPARVAPEPAEPEAAIEIAERAEIAERLEIAERVENAEAPPAPEEAGFEQASDVELAIAFELDTLRDLEVIEELELLEALLTLEESEQKSVEGQETS